MRSKAPWLLALPALILALCLAPWSGEPNTNGSASSAPAAQAQSDQGQADLEAPVAERAQATPQPKTESDPAATRAHPGSPTAEVPYGSGLLSGTLRCIDASGRTLPDVDLVLSLTLEQPEQGQGLPLRVQVHAGRWSTKIDLLAGHSAVRFEPLVRLGQLCPLVQPSAALALPIAGPVDLVYRLPDPVQLRVYAADSGLELTEVWLAEDPGLSLQGPSHPGVESLARTIRRGLASPIDVTELKWVRGQGSEYGNSLSLFVGGPEHAWVHTRVPLLAGGTHRVDLQPAATLIVEVAGVLTPGLDLNLRLYTRADGDILCSLPLTGTGPQRFVGLAPGKLEARIEIGNWFPKPELVVAEPVLLVAGETTTLRLVLPEQAPITYGRLAGTVLWPPGWEVGNAATLVAWRLDASRRPAELGGPVSSRARKPGAVTSLDGNDPIHLRLQPVPGTPPGWTAAAFEFPELETGRYELRVQPSNTSFPVRGEALAGAPLELRVGAPVGLTLRFVDAVTGTALRPESLYWCPTRPKAVPMEFMEPVPFDAALDAYRLVGPQGTIKINGQLEGYATIHVSDLAIGPGEPSERRFALQRAAELLVRLTSGGELLQIEAELKLPVLRADTREPVVAGFPVESHQRRFTVPANGTYIVEPPELPGVVAPPAREIHVSSDEPAELVYEYQRAP